VGAEGLACTEGLACAEGLKTARKGMFRDRNGNFLWAILSRIFII
jgi:hypothetical protein